MEFTDENVNITHKAKKVIIGNQTRFDKENAQRGVVHNPVKIPQSEPVLSGQIPSKKA